MKLAIGKYTKVKAVTKEEAINLTKEIFNESTEGYKLYAEERKLRAEGRKLYAEGRKLCAEGDKLHAEGDKLYAELAIKYNAYIPDHRVINLIAKDLPNHVYCFVFNRKELWVYDGENCPDYHKVEKIDL